MTTFDIDVEIIGASFAWQYYQVLCKMPNLSHQFYDNNSSTMTRVNADHTKVTVSTIADIDLLLISLRVTEVELTELNVQKSWKGGLFVVVSGIMRSRNFDGKTNFSQSFFLAPHYNSFLVANDILQFHDEDVVNQHPVPVFLIESEVPAYNLHDEQPATSVSGYELEETEEYSLPDDQQHEDVESADDSAPHESGVSHVEDLINSPATALTSARVDELADDSIVEEASVEQSSTLASVVNHLEDPIHWPALALASARADELAIKPAAESDGAPASVSSYASILQAPKGQSSQPFVPRQPSVRQSMPASEVKQTSVFVGNLPSHVTTYDLLKEFNNFGKIKPNEVTIRNKTETGVCFAFVEFEDVSGAHSAIKASPIKLLGNQVYINENRSSSSTSKRGRRRRNKQKTWPSK